MLVGTGADEVNIISVLLRTLEHKPRDFELVHARWHLCQLTATQLGWNFIEQCFDAIDTDGLQHRFNVGFSVWNKWHDCPISISPQSTQ